MAKKQEIPKKLRMSRRPLSVPSKLTVLGTRYKVSWDENIEDGTYAATDSDKKKILLSTSQSKLSELRETLLHESIHGIFAESGLTEILGDKLEEAVCRAIEAGLPRIIKEIYG